MTDDPPSTRFLDAEARWQKVLRALSSEGWTIAVTCHAAPVQLEGTVPTGERFYFRCRWELCELGIGGHDPVDSPTWEDATTLANKLAASHLSPDEATRILLELHARWLKSLPPTHPASPAT